jgi:acetamidase/formamidase
MAETHYFPEDKVHYVWDNELDPALTVAPGDTVVYRTREVSDGQISPSSTTEDLAGLDWERLYPLAGPVAVEGAEPGDAVEVEVLDIHTEGWGWAAVLPGFGLLEEDFSEAYLKVFDLSSSTSRPATTPSSRTTSPSPSSPFSGRWASPPSAPRNP